MSKTIYILKSVLELSDKIDKENSTVFTKEGEPESLPEVEGYVKAELYV